MRPASYIHRRGAAELKAIVPTLPAINPAGTTNKYSGGCATKRWVVCGWPLDHKNRQGGLWRRRLRKKTAGYAWNEDQQRWSRQNLQDQRLLIESQTADESGPTDFQPKTSGLDNWIGISDTGVLTLCAQLCKKGIQDVKSNNKKNLNLFLHRYRICIIEILFTNS